MVRALSSHFKPEEEVEEEEEEEEGEEKEEEEEANCRHLGHNCNFNMFHTYNQKSYELRTVSWFQEVRVGQHGIIHVCLYPCQASLMDSSSSFPLSSTALGPPHCSLASPEQQNYRQGSLHLPPYWLLSPRERLFNE